ncbi:hypothetical protein [Thermincola ferriacetica]
MLLNLFKAINNMQPKVRELDPTTTQRIKEGAYLTKIISETEVAARKCEFYAGNCSDEQIAQFFQDEADMLYKAKHTLQKYYESMTEE